MKPILSSGSIAYQYPQTNYENISPCKSPALKELEDRIATDPRLSNYGIEQIFTMLPPNVRIVANLEPNRLFSCVVKNDEAIGIDSVSSGVALCARGTNANGEAVLAMMLVLHEDGAAKMAFNAIRKAMAREGIECPWFYLVGGLLQTGNSPTEDDMMLAYDLLKAGGQDIVAARLGITGASGWYTSPGHPDEFIHTNLSGSVSVVLTATGLFYRPEDSHSAHQTYQTNKPNLLFDPDLIFESGELVPGFEDWRNESIYESDFEPCTSPMLAKLEHMVLTDKRLSCKKFIQECFEPLPPSIRVMANVEMNYIYCCVVENDEAIGTVGVGPCVALCARGKNMLGQTVLALMHVADEDGIAKRAIDAILSAMNQKGVAQPSLYLVGGMVKLGNTYKTDTMELAYKLLEAGGEYIVAARLGTAVCSGKYSTPSKPDELLIPDRPNAVSVVITATGIFYSAEPSYNENFSYLFDFVSVNNKGKLVEGCEYTDSDSGF